MTGSVVTARGFFTQVNCTLCVFLLLIRSASRNVLYIILMHLYVLMLILMSVFRFLRLIFPLNGVVSSPAVHPGCVSSPSSCAGCDGV
jgi:hypothetical protein